MRRERVTRRNGATEILITEGPVSIAENATLPMAFAKIGPFLAGPAFAHPCRMLIDAPYNAITREILSAAIEVHRTLGPGLFESTYVPCLHYELGARKLRF